jgi:hypothetical protein
VPAELLELIATRMQQLAKLDGGQQRWHPPSLAPALMPPRSSLCRPAVAYLALERRAGSGAGSAAVT